MTGMRRVLGVDGCRAGWVGVRWTGGSAGNATVLVASDIGALVERAGEVAVVAIDIPIGLPANERHEAESLARRRLPGRASTVFNRPAAATLGATTYAEANQANREALGLGLSRQSYSLLPKIADVQDWLSTRPPVAVVEAHPEVCFAALHGSVVTLPKSTPEGAALRRTLLAAVGIEVDLHHRVGVGVDDVLDAAAVAWTASRVRDGIAERLPAEPRDEPAPAIWV